MRGRLPGWMQFGWPGVVFRLRSRFPCVTPVTPPSPLSPKTLQLGVADTTLPQRSATTHVVVPPGPGMYLAPGLIGTIW